MTEIERVELNDNLIYMYIICAAINIILSMVLIVSIITQWKNASSAVNPSQYKLRNFYISSLLIASIASLFECSAKQMQNLSQVFELAAKKAIEYRKTKTNSKSDKKCIIQ